MKGDISLDPKCKYPHSRYAHLVLIDNRQSNQYLGFIQSGLLNAKKTLFYDGDFKKDLTNLFVNGDKEGDTLILIIDKIYLSEKTRFADELGFIQYKMRMYASSNDGVFRSIFDKSETKELKAFDISKTLKKGFSDLFCEMTTIASQSPNFIDYNKYTFAEINNLDNIAKSKIPIYNDESFKKGIYVDFEQFRLNLPNYKEIIIEDNGNKIKVFGIDNYTNKKVRISPEGIYAISDGTTLLKSTTGGFVHLKKENTDFYYEDLLNESNPDMGFIMFGLVGAAIASSTSNAHGSSYFKMKIDYKTGDPIPIQKMD